MPWHTWKQLTTKQQIQVRMLRLDWNPEEFYRFEFYVKLDGNVHNRRGGNAHRLTEQAARAEFDKYNKSIYNAEKGDLHLWGPGHSFTFIRD